MTHPNSTPRTRRDGALASLLAAVVLVALAPNFALAQSDAPDCVAIVAEMLTPTPSSGAIRASAGCPSTGPVTLANRWTRRGTRSAAERAALVEASTLMRDARLYDGVSAVVRDDSYPSLDRRAALRVLVSYAETHSVMQQGQARSLTRADASSARHEESSDTITGSIVLRPLVRDAIRHEIARLASSDRDPDVRLAAQRARESLGDAMAPTGKAAVNRKP